MGGSSMSYTMLMATMVVLSWRLNMMERLTILMLFTMLVMDILVVDMFKKISNKFFLVSIGLTCI